MGLNAFITRTAPNGCQDNEQPVSQPVYLLKWRRLRPMFTIQRLATGIAGAVQVAHELAAIPGQRVRLRCSVDAQLDIDTLYGHG